MKIILLGTALSALMGVVIGTSLNPHLDQPDPSGSYVQTKSPDTMEIAESAPANVRAMGAPAVTSAPLTTAPLTTGPLATAPRERSVPLNDPDAEEQRGGDTAPQMKSPADADSGPTEPSNLKPLHSDAKRTLYATADPAADGDAIDTVQRPSATMVQYTASDTDALDIAQR